MSPHFTKFHGFGNDYIVIESKELVGREDLGQFAREICNRHLGAGADGIAVVSPADGDIADFHVRIFNPDGSEAGLSGNGTRCAAAYLHYQKLWSDEELLLSTRSGVKRYLLCDENKGRYVFDSELGVPQFSSEAIPMVTRTSLETVIDYPLPVDEDLLKVTALRLGNPNCCVLVDDFAKLDWRRLGKAIEVHKQFPERTNVVFIKVLDRERIELRIWERGVGETTASGTCSCAAAVAAMLNGKTDRLVTAIMPGGEARIGWREDGEVVITGSAEVVYSADWLVSDD
jgi:diaminopimelate epimerase